LSKFNGSYIPKSAMAIFAHPDDSEFTVGGTIAKWADAGCEITMVLCTSGNVGTHDPKYTLKTLAKTREAEQKAVAEFFGVKHVVFLRHGDCALLRAELVQLLQLRDADGSGQVRETVIESDFVVEEFQCPGLGRRTEVLGPRR